MLTFNEYFGYRDTMANKSKRSLKRTQISCEKLGESIQKKKSNHKSQHPSNFLPSRITKMQSPSKSHQRTLKISPFKTLSKKGNTGQRKSLKPVKKKKISEQDKHIYDRFSKEDFKTKKDLVDHRKDSLILNFIRRREIDDSIRKSKHESEASPSFKIKNQCFKARLQENSFSEDKQPNINNHIFPRKTNISKRQSCNRFINPMAYSTQRNQNQLHRSCDTINISSEIGNDNAVKVNNQQSYEDVYQIKAGGKNPMKNILSLRLSGDFANTLKNSSKIKRKQYSDSNIISLEPVEARIKNHYGELQKFLKFVEEMFQLYNTSQISFQRQIYLCRKMYFKMLCDMRDSLKGYPVFKNCFILKSCRIMDRELNQHRSYAAQNFALRIRQLQSEIQAMKESLIQQSVQLIQKDPNDPYIHFENNNFETELVNEVYEEVLILTQKLGRKNVEKKEQLSKRRKNATDLIFLIAQLCGVWKQAHQIKETQTAEVFFQQNHHFLEKIMQKFQQMPL